MNNQTDIPESNLGDTENNSAGITPDSPVISAGSTGGFTILINWVIISKELVTPDNLPITLGATPILGAMVAAVITYIWRSYGRNPEYNEAMKRLKRREKQCKKDMIDPLLSKQEQKAAKADYATVKEIMRNL